VQNNTHGKQLSHRDRFAVAYFGEEDMRAGLLGRSLEPDIQEGIGHTARKKQIDLYRARKGIGHGRHAEGEHKAGKAVPGTHGV
jgi:hypothetical protein